MHLIAPDIMAGGRDLSVGACGVGLGVGAVIWMLGGWSQRFWMVMLVTLGAGVYGLSIGDAFSVQPLVAALLMAVAGGLLALSLVRVAAFVAGGVAGCVLAEQLLTRWHEPFIFFFVGAFLGLFLLRFWLMILASLTGTLLMAYSLLWMLDTMGKLDAVDFSTRKPVLLNWACGGVTLLGLLIQVGIERRFRPRKEEEDEEREDRSRRKFLGLFGGGDSRKRSRRAA
jgi:MFS family permease